MNTIPHPAQLTERMQEADDLAFAELELVRSKGLACRPQACSRRLHTLLGQLLQSGADRVDTVLLASVIIGLGTKDVQP